MDNKKDDSYYLEKILKDLKFLIENTEYKSKKEIKNNQILIDSIMYRLIKISENSDKLSLNFKNNNFNLPWKEIKGMRNRIVHDYGVVDLTIIYDTIKNDIPLMYNQLKIIYENNI